MEGIHFKVSAKHFEFKHFQIIFNMQHHLKVHFLPQAQLYNSKIMVPLYFSKKILRKRHFVSRLINTKLSFNSKTLYLSLLYSLARVNETIKTLNKFYNNKISALTSRDAEFVIYLHTCYSDTRCHSKQVPTALLL